MAATSIVHRGIQAFSQNSALVAFIVVLAYIIYTFIYIPLYATPLCRIPGPTSFALTKWRLALGDRQGVRTRLIHSLHEKYGTAVRIGPNEVSFSSLSALRAIYGAGSGFERTEFYRMFDVYGRQNLFTFAGVKPHAERKKLLAHAYSKSVILSPNAIAKPLIERNVKEYLELLATEKDIAEEIFRSLHWFSLDSITGFLYGDQHGGTHALRGNEEDRRLLNDIVDPTRKMLSWYAVHLRGYTKWLYTRSGVMEKVVTGLGLLPMKKPATYTGIRAHALKSWSSFDEAMAEKDSPDLSIMEKLSTHSKTGKGTRLEALDIASELADHFLAGIDTTSDTAMFAIWALSLPKHREYQQALIEEVDSISNMDCNEDGNPTVEAASKLPYLDAILKETLRLYAPLPASEPRSLPVDTTIDGYLIPAGTVVSMSPYTLHRNPDVFPEPLQFKPERWLGECGDLVEMKKWFWAFSSGGRMCIGLHLAMAEMTTLLAAIYRKYTTNRHKHQMEASPGITSRFEVFYDETFPEVEEHQCWINFDKRGN
ncbi:putative benzoate 4-monooxygenase cytochrome P450 [Thelonectria olida]|uniref:Benzoate 4-monooxygenase cytochrome P450 n=1 Tax=Thelonectria olida TaxID=1576542 RepID=A0A9P8W4E8_9HYPO|nr:putative benzoate 4-monooxygenase cytochrome P450 [Thelonectria olida]